jgi:hypothetical protein
LIETPFLKGLVRMRGDLKPLMLLKRSLLLGRAAEEGQHPAKRRRLSALSRPQDELRSSLYNLYAKLNADASSVRSGRELHGTELVTVTAVSAHGETRSFRCMRALLASASRPLDAMLYGFDGMRMAESEQSCVSLQGVEPRTFELLLRYLHGNELQLDEQRAIALFTLADYYAIVSLRDACCELLEAYITPSNVCRWLAQARQLGCERLAHRCLQMLETDLTTIESTDAEFASLGEEDLMQAVRSSSLVCAGVRRMRRRMRAARACAHSRWPPRHLAALAPPPPRALAPRRADPSLRIPAVSRS